MLGFSEIYFFIVNILASAVFAYDKHCARINKRRVPEVWLHVLEMTGGVFGVMILMYTIRHKNRKFSYFAYTYLILFVWIAALYSIFFLR